MLHTNNQIIKHKVGLLNLAEELQNVSRACKVMGVSRDTFYRYKELVEEASLDSLISRVDGHQISKIALMTQRNKPLFVMLLTILLMVSIKQAISFVSKVFLFQEVACALFG
ncbi:hypothetical protein A9G41_11810 [Gilliamella sp. Nev5-1]|nr:hypothetical protein A9G41_11810 [Gilliamella apicola]